MPTTPMSTTMRGGHAEQGHHRATRCAQHVAERHLRGAATREWHPREHPHQASAALSRAVAVRMASTGATRTARHTGYGGGGERQGQSERRAPEERAPLEPGVTQTGSGRNPSSRTPPIAVRLSSRPTSHPERRAEQRHLERRRAAVGPARVGDGRARAPCRCRSRAAVLHDAAHQVEGRERGAGQHQQARRWS